MFVTVTLTDVDVRVLPLASRAIAVNVCDPFVAASVPRELIRRGQVLRAEVDAVDPELHADDADVVARGCGIVVTPLTGRLRPEP